MQNKCLTVMSFVLAFTLLFTGFVGYDTHAKAASKTNFVSQVDPRYPSEDPTSRVLARDRRTFKGYKGAGEIIVENNGVTNVEVYINGKAVDMQDALSSKNKVTTIDISKYTVNGANIIKVENIEPEETYLNIYIPYPKLRQGKPEEVGFSEEKLAKIDALIESEVEDGFPGAALLIAKDGKVIKKSAYGYKVKYDGDQLLAKCPPMEEDTIFDQASNTKMFATNIAIQKLVSEGKININDKVSKYIPGFVGGGRENITIKHLLTHTAGFEAWIGFHNPNNHYGKEMYSLDRDRTLRLLEQIPLTYETGTKTIYSDIDYMLLGYIIENVTGQKLDLYVENNIYKPLGLKHTCYNPLKKGFSLDRFAATETMGNTRGGTIDFPSIRKYTLRGEVHDEITYYSMDGVSGHAGLFSNTQDMAVLCQMVLNGGGYGDVKIFDKGVLDQFTKPSDNDITFGLGWNRAGNMDRIWQFGPYASDTAIGHTGWTGTLTLIDPKYELVIVLLTNKKHSEIIDGRFDGDKYQTGMYGSIVSLVYEAFLENK